MSDSSDISNASRDRLRDKRRIVASVAALVAIPPFIFCQMKHYCMCGHMAHGRSPAWHHVSDGLWIVLLVVAAVFAIQSNMRWKSAFCITSAAVAFTVGEGCACFPLCLIIPVAAVMGLRGPAPVRQIEGVCATCGYNLTGNVSGICPECGTAVPEAAARDALSRSGIHDE